MYIKKIHTYTIALLVSFGILIGGYVLYMSMKNKYVDSPTSGQQNIPNTSTSDASKVTADKIKNAYNLIGSGEYSSAIQIYQEIFAQNNLKPEELRIVKMQYANTLILMGEDYYDEAYTIFREVLQDTESTDRERLMVLHSVLSLFEIDGDGEKVERLLESPFFVDKNIPEGEVMLKVRRIAEISNEYGKSAINLQREGFWYANQLLDNQSLTAIQRNDYEKKLHELIEESRDYPYLIVSDRSYPMISYLEMHFRLFNLGALATVDAQYAEKLTAEFKTIQQSIPRYMAMQDPLVPTLVPYTYFYYAAFLQKVDSIEFKNEIVSLMNELVSMLHGESGLGQRVGLRFIEFAKKVSDGDVTHHNYIFFKNLSKLNSEFSEILKSNNIEFSR